ncbi:MAG: TIGR00282 family metallophosphoesterase [Clostridia bacterium]|nr:TIGR00282 family metallophosphoesterase [Clostridia bacterium]MCI8961325.1 TIGR00282 family metallophosphoesterase [Clostridia bacterium]
MRILAVGDLIGESGLKKAKEIVSELKEKEKIDFIIVNGENVAEGMGITLKHFNNILSIGTNVVTMGNHTWAKKDIFSFINHEQLIRPANYPEGVPGKGYIICKCKDKKIGVINLIGRTEMGILTENPFVIGKRIVEKLKKEVDIVIIDFHAEATAEKVAMGNYLDGIATIVYGTHTHVQTSDDRILPKGTGYLTDIGMTGPKNSVIGMDIEASLKRFVTTLPERYKMAEGECIFNGCIFDINDETCRVDKITRIYL